MHNARAAAAAMLFDVALDEPFEDYRPVQEANTNLSPRIVA
ncbi:MAG: hypothetical protein AB8H86_11385 [Polyangiales bacterium]